MFKNVENIGTKVCKWHWILVHLRKRYKKCSCKFEVRTQQQGLDLRATGPTAKQFHRTPPHSPGWGAVVRPLAVVSRPTASGVGRQLQVNWTQEQLGHPAAMLCMLHQPHAAPAWKIQCQCVRYKARCPLWLRALCSSTCETHWSNCPN